MYGTLQGKGTVRNALVAIENGGVLDPGQVDVVYYTEASHTYTAQPDDVTGTLTLYGGLAVHSGGLLSFDVLSSTDYDSIVLNESSVTYSGTTYYFSDDLDLSNATIQLTFGDDFNWDEPSLSALLIATAGTVTGLDSATIQYILQPGSSPVDSLPTDVRGTWSVNSAGVVLTILDLPEPSSMLLLIVGAAGLCWRRRRLAG